MFPIDNRLGDRALVVAISTIKRVCQEFAVACHSRQLLYHYWYLVTLHVYPTYKPNQIGDPALIYAIQVTSDYRLMFWLEI